MKIYLAIEELISYAEKHLYAEQRDRLYYRHRLYHFLGLNGEDLGLGLTGEAEPAPDIYQVCQPILDWAKETQVFDAASIVEEDLFLANLLGQVCPPPSLTEELFWTNYQLDPALASKKFYSFSQNSAYIRMDRMAQNISWEGSSDYGPLRITINLAKPEKDPKAIAKAAQQAPSSYPKCVLCMENEAYPGHLNWAPRLNHRCIRMRLDGEDFAFQYSPYLYYPEHSIVFSTEHRPMEISERSFRQLFAFCQQLPHYMVGSNADLPIVGGSILSHHHFQAGRFDFPMFEAKTLDRRDIVDGCHLEVLHWPLSVLRISGSDVFLLSKVAGRILEEWKAYSKPDLGILAHSQGEDGQEQPHNTITPIARYHQGVYQLYLVLRNNRCSDEHPLGIFHPHSEVHHIKKENIGLIEVMGLAVLPSRLQNALPAMASYLRTAQSKKAAVPPGLEAHISWLDSLLPKVPSNSNALEDFLRSEITAVFAQVLSHCAVFPSFKTPQGKEAYLDFIQKITLV